MPSSTYYLDVDGPRPGGVKTSLGTVGQSSKLTGRHGVALVAVTAQTDSGDVKFVQGKTNDVTPSANLAFVCEVQNQGSVAEHDVVVTATLTVPGGDPLKQEGTISVIEPDKTELVTISGFAIPEEALSKVVTLKVTAGPVKGEAVETNNTASFKLLLQLQ